MAKIGNPWAVTLNCPVKVCQAQFCNPQRLQRCALRLCWLQRHAELLSLLSQCRSRAASLYLKSLLEKMDG